MHGYDNKTDFKHHWIVCALDSSSLLGVYVDFKCPCFHGDVQLLSLQEFVQTRELFKRYEETYLDCKRQADIYKKEHPEGEWF